MPNICFEKIQPLPLLQAIALAAKNDMRILVATIDKEEDMDNLLIKDPDNFEALRLASQKHNEKRREADFILTSLSNRPKEEEWAFWLSFLVINMGSGKSTKDGLYRFFFGGAGAYADKISQILEEIGLKAHAEIFKEAISLFDTPYPLKNIDRFRYYGASPYTTKSSPNHNSFDEKLLALGEKFKHLTNFEISACAKLNSLESLTEFKSRVMTHFPEEDLLNWLALQIDHELEKLENTHRNLQISHPYFDFHLLWRLYGEICNGGLPCFFFISSGNLAGQTLAALKHYIQQDAALIFEKALSLFPTPFTFDIELRRHFLLIEGEALEHQLDKLDMDIYLDEIWESCKHITNHSIHSKT